MALNSNLLEDDLTFQIDVPPACRAYLDDALMRLGYLYPDADFSIDGGTVAVRANGHESSSIKRDVRFFLYRQKIYAENIELRQRLMKGIMGQ